MRINKKVVMLYFLGFLLMGIALYFVEQVKQEKREQRKIYCDSLKGEELLRVVVNKYFQELYLDLVNFKNTRYCHYLSVDDGFRECNFFTINKDLDREKINNIIEGELTFKGYSSPGDLGVIVEKYLEEELSTISIENFKKLDMLSILEKKNILHLEISSRLRLYQKKSFRIENNKLWVVYSSAEATHYDDRKDALRYKNTEVFNIGYCGDLYEEGIYE